jgi:hypothetical protein
MFFQRLSQHYGLMRNAGQFFGSPNKKNAAASADTSAPLASANA